MKSTSHKGHIDRKLLNELGPEDVFSVLGSFSQGAYLEDACGRIVLLCDDCYGQIPFAVAVGGYPALLGPSRITQQTRLYLKDGHIIAEEEPIIELVSYDARDEGILPVPDIRRMRIWKDALADCGRGAFRALADAGRETDDSKAVMAILRGRGIGELDEEEQIRLLEEIIGRGPGLTPSGDDLLCGYLYLTLHTGRDVEKLMKHAEEMMKERTNRISRLYLRHVMDGGRFSLFDDVLKAAEDSEARRAADRLLGMGSNSGADILCGMLMACREDC